MRCLIAVEPQAASIIKSNLETAYPDWTFETCQKAQELRQHSINQPDIVLVSRFLPGEDAIVLLEFLPLMFSTSHLVLLAGVINEQVKAYIRAANKRGINNIVTGKLPGDRPYTIFTALTEARNTRIELQQDDLEQNFNGPQEKQQEKSENGWAEAATMVTPSETASILSVFKKELKPVQETRLLEPLKSASEPRHEKPYPVQCRRGAGKFIITTANKGGVGKTTVAISLAMTLADTGIPTVLCDFDLGAPDIATFFDLQGVTGLEQLQGKYNLSNYLPDLIIQKKNLHILPGPMDKTVLPRFEPEQITEMVNYLTTQYSIVVGDTSPEFWTKPWMGPILQTADIVLAVVDQSKFSEVETRDYAPKLLSMGTTPEKIKIVCNRFNPKLHNVKKVESYFNQGFKKGKVLPQVIATIPENWERFVADSYRGEITGKEDVYNPWEQLTESVLKTAGLPINLNPLKKTKKSWFSFFNKN